MHLIHSVLQPKTKKQMTDWLGRHDVDVENMWAFKDIAMIFDELKEGHSMFVEDETGTVSH